MVRLHVVMRPTRFQKARRLRVPAEGLELLFPCVVTGRDCPNGTGITLFRMISGLEEFHERFKFLRGRPCKTETDWNLSECC